MASFKLTDFDQESEVHLGFTDENAFTGSLSVHQTVTTGDFYTWWTLPVDDIKYDTTSVQSSTQLHAIIDSGTSLILLAESDYALFVKQI